MISSDDEARAIRAEKSRQERKAKKSCNDIEVEKANLSLHLTEESRVENVKTVNDMLSTVRNMQRQIDEDIRFKQYLIQRLRWEQAITIAFDDPMSKTVVEYLDEKLKRQ